MRDRLAALLERAEKIEELLSIEKELQRVTSDLERIKGRIKYLTNAVNYSTLTVRVNTPIAQVELREVIPFPWVRSLASDVLLRPGDRFTPVRRWRRWLRMDTPPGFVTVSDVRDHTRMMNGNFVTLLARRHKNFEDGRLDFWEPLIRRHLMAGKTLAMGETEPIRLDSGARGLKLSGTLTQNRKLHRYALWIVATDSDIYTLECWGADEEVESLMPQLEKSARSMRIRP
jgi:hypothetical protein